MNNQQLDAILNFRPVLDGGRDLSKEYEGEPSLKMLVENYFNHVLFQPEQAKAFAQEYLDNLLNGVK